MVIQVIIRLTLYLDQAITRSGHDMGNGSRYGIDNTVHYLHFKIIINICQIKF